MSAPRHLTFRGVPIEWDDPEAKLVVCDLRSLNEMSTDLESMAAQLTEVSAAIGSDEFLDLPDGGSVTLAEQVRRMRAALAEARAELADVSRQLLATRKSAISHANRAIGLTETIQQHNESARSLQLGENWLIPLPAAQGSAHASDCALHNAPALPVGPCDCGVEQQSKAPEVDRFRDALTSIANSSCCGGCQEAALVARAALSSTDCFTGISKNPASSL